MKYLKSKLQFKIQNLKSKINNSNPKYNIVFHSAHLVQTDSFSAGCMISLHTNFEYVTKKIFHNNN